MRTIAILLVAALASCATGPSRQDILAGLVGHPESDALRVLGAPNHLLETTGHRFLAYEDQQTDYVPVSPFGPFGYAYFPVTVPVQRACTMTIEIVKGVVASWTLRGDAC